MKIFKVLLFLTLWGGSVFAQECVCSAALDTLVSAFETNYSRFRLKVDPGRHAPYHAHLLQTARQAAQVEQDSCKRVLESYLAYFQDGHVWINEHTEQGPIPAPEERDIDQAQARAYFDRHREQLHPLEGIWESDYYTIALMQDPDAKQKEWVGIVLDTRSSRWSPGQVKLKVKPTATGSYECTYLMGNYSPRITSAELLEDHRLLRIQDVNVWSKQYPLPPGTIAIDYRLHHPAAPRLKIIDADHILLSIPTFSGEVKPLLDSLLHHFQPQLSTTPNLLIDVRENGGGSDYTYAELMKYIYTDTIRLPTSGMWLSAHNNQHFLSWVADEDRATWDEDKERMYHMIETKQDTMVFWGEEDYIKIGYQEVLPYPEKVAILTSRESASSAETFVMKAQQSHKVTIMGENTAGIVDGFNVHSIDLGCYQLYYPTGIRSKFLPEDGVEPDGIAPDIRLDVHASQFLAEVIKALHQR